MSLGVTENLTADASAIIELSTMHEISGRRRLGRRTLLSTGGVGLVGAGALLYQAAPGFWQQYTREFKRPVTPSPRVPNPLNWPDRGIYGAWLGHSTVLLKIDG